MKTLKGYVRNRARPEGSIAEAYIVKECLTFCSMYLRQTDRVERYDDGGERGPGMSVFTQTVCPIGLMPWAHDPSQRERDIAHWFVLNNCPEVEPYLQYVLQSSHIYALLVNSFIHSLLVFIH